MLISISSSPQQVSSDFTTLSATEGCGSLVVEFQDISTGSPNAWLWDFGNGNSSNLKDPIVIYSNPGKYNVTLTVSNNSTSDTKIYNELIIVYKNPTSESSTNSVISGCIPLKVEFEDLSVTDNMIINWQWDFGDGGSSSLQDPLYQYETNGNFSVTLLVTDINGCQALSTETNLIQVDESPVSSFIADITLSCNSTELITFNNNTFPEYASYIWHFGDGDTSLLESPSHNYSSGSYTVSLLSKIGSCIDTAIQTNYIEVGTELNPDFIYDIDTGCEDMEVNFTDITLNEPDSWFWDFGDGNTSLLQNPTHLYDSAGIYNVTLITSRLGQCQDSYTINDAIKVYEKPMIQIKADTTYSCTIPFNVEFYDITDGSVSWHWDFGNNINSSIQNPDVLYTNYDVYNTALTVVNTEGCSSTKEFIDFIKIEKISVSISASAINGCVPFDVEFTDSTNSIRPLIDWRWDFGTGNIVTIENPLYQYNSGGLFDVSLVVENDYGCIADLTIVDYIEVNTVPEIEFESSSNLICIGQDINFFDVSISDDSITDWLWDFGNNITSNLQNPIYQYQLPGNYDVTLIASVNSCKDSLRILDYIEVVEPRARFYEEYNCDTFLQVKFINESIGADSVFWNFGDGNTSNLLNPVHSYAIKGVYDVSLSVTNMSTGCTHEVERSLKLTVPQASFDYLINPNASYEDSVGCIPKWVHLDVNNSLDMAYYKVLWSDGYVGHGRADHLFTTTGSFDVTLIVSDIHHCTDTMKIENMYHLHDVDANFGISNILGCDSMLVEFKDLSNPPSSVFWDFGDGNFSSMNNPDHIYYSEGYYDVTLYAESSYGCKDTLERIEYIRYQYPTADFNSNIQEVCSNDLVEFTNLSDGIGLNNVWQFGDGTQSYQISPTHSFIDNGIYDVSLLVTDSFGCSNSLFLYEYIKVLQPTANFITGGTSSSCPPLISNFTNLSTNDVVNWEWLFSDGGSSFLSDPSHLFSSSGTFDVSLVVANQYGCKDTLIQNGLIDISGPTGTFNISDNAICKNESIQFTPLVSNVNSYLWDFGNGFLSTDSFPSHSYNIGGVFLPVLIIEDSTGCQLIVNEMDTIIVRSVSLDAGININICAGEEVQLNALGDAQQFLWNPILSLSNSEISNPIASPVSDIMYYVYHSDGVCNETDSVFIKVNNDIPSASFSTINNCAGDIVQFSASSGLLTSNVSWEWSFGSSIQNPFKELTLGAHEIELITVNLDNNCSDTLVQQVQIYPLPTASFSATEVCFGEPVVFTDNSSVNTVGWEYDFADGIGISTNQSPTYMYDNPGIFNVNLNIVSDHGCKNNSTVDVIVNELPIADFSIKNHCEGEGNVFTDLSSVINSKIALIEYNFNNNSISSDSIATNVFNGYGFFNVELTAISEDGCKDTIKKITQVFANPRVDFSTLGSCEGEQTIFNSFSSVLDADILDYNWTFGLDGVSSDKNTSHIFSSNGMHNVSLSITSDQGCISEINKVINIHKLPSSSFRVPSDICLGDEVQISYLSDGNSDNVISWNYTFGDKNTSVKQNPFHTYSSVNKFDISLEVTSSSGCVNDTTIPAIIEVHALPFADFYASTLIASEIESEICFYNTSSGATSYFWSFDNGDYSYDESPRYDFIDVKNYNVLLTVTDDFGCQSEVTRVVKIHPEYTIFIPNSFTPDSDGMNDIFEAQGTGIVEFEMKVFDRWGGLIFESTNIDLGWDGNNYSGLPTDNGVYLYHVTLYDYNGRIWVYNGDIKLTR